MTPRPTVLTGAALVSALLVAPACSSGSDSTTTAGTDGTGTTATRTGCTPIDLVTAESATTGPGDAGGSATVTPLGTYTLAGGTDSQSGTTYTATDDDTSGVLVTDGGVLTLTDVAVTTSSNSSSTDESSFYGLDAGVLATGGATITVDGGTITTSGSGANGAFASETGSSVVLCDVTIDATGAVGHGIMAAGGGTVSALDLTVSTTGSNGAAIATDRGGGAIAAQGGSYLTSGTDSPVLYSTGTLVVQGITGDATGSEAAVIEGSNSIEVTDSTLSGAKKSGVMILQTMSGDSSGDNGTFTMSGGSLQNDEGPLLFVTNSTGTVELTGVEVRAGSGVLLKAAADRWGTSGSNGGTATLDASRQSLTGDVVVDADSSAVLVLSDQSTFTGTVDGDGTGSAVTIRLDGSSTWTVTGDSYVSVLDDTAGVSGTTITNIIGNGHTVYYDASSNSALDGQTYSLADGGTLTPA